MALLSATNLTNVYADTLTLFNALNDASDGAGGTPPVDVNLLAGLFQNMSLGFKHCVQGTHTASAALAADALEFIVGFVPKVVIVWNATTSPNLQIKLASHATSFALRMVAVGPVWSFAANRITMGLTLSATRTDGFTIDAANIAASDVLHYVVLG